MSINPDKLKIDRNILIKMRIRKIDLKAIISCGGGDVKRFFIKNPKTRSENYCLTKEGGVCYA